MISLSFLNLGVDIFCLLVSDACCKLLAKNSLSTSGILQQPTHPAQDGKNEREGKKKQKKKKKKKNYTLRGFNSATGAERKRLVLHCSSSLWIKRRIAATQPEPIRNAAPTNGSTPAQQHRRRRCHHRRRRKKQSRNFQGLRGGFAQLSGK